MKFLLPIIVIVVILASGYFAFNRYSQPTTLLTPPQAKQTPSPSPKSQELKTFQSKLMRFSVELPSNFSVEEKFGSVLISAPKGEIYIDKNGTNFDDLDSYIEDLCQKNKFTLMDKKSVVINGLSSIFGETGEEKLYFIYKDNTVYTLSTKTEELHTDLDQIAQSFRYIP